jgi:hypothetical protein
MKIMEIMAILEMQQAQRLSHHIPEIGGCLRPLRRPSHSLRIATQQPR